jgi:hypothetical protein
MIKDFHFDKTCMQEFSYFNFFQNRYYNTSIFFTFKLEIRATLKSLAKSLMISRILQ